MFLRRGLWLTAAGIALGIGVALALTRVMSALLFGVGPMDPITYAAVSGVLAAVALLATYLPARRASIPSSPCELTSSTKAASEICIQISDGIPAWRGASRSAGGACLSRRSHQPVANSVPASQPAQVPSGNPFRSSGLLPSSGSNPNESLSETSHRLTGRTTDSSSVCLSAANDLY